MPEYTSRNAENRSYDKLWTHRGNKFVIGTIHGAMVEIVAQYNPKELSRSVQADWNAHPNTSANQSKTSQNGVWAEYGTTKPRSVSLELVFDGYEEGISVSPIVEALESLTMPVDMNSSDPTKRRPQLCVAVWGTQQLRCVVESVATKLTMFDLSGEPLRATCTVQLKEVDVASMLQAEAATATSRARKAGGGYEHTPVKHERNPYPPEDTKATRVPRTSDPTASDTTNAAAQRRVDEDKQTKSVGVQPKPAPTPAPKAPSTASEPIVTSPTVTNSDSQPASAPIVTSPTVTNSDASAPSKTVGVPSAQLDPTSKDDPDGPRLIDKPTNDADAVSSADGQDPNAKYRLASKDME